MVKAENRESTCGGRHLAPDTGAVTTFGAGKGSCSKNYDASLFAAHRRCLVVWTGPSDWTPIGRRFAFVRAEAPETTFVVIANADGSGERVLAERQRPAQFVSLMIAARPSIAPTWSPDGRWLAIAGAGAGTDPDGGDVAFIDVESGQLRTIALPTSAVRGLVWFDDSTLLLNAAVSEGSLQLHQLTYPSGQLSPLTREVNDYDGISLAGDRQTLVGSRRERQTNLAILDATGRPVTAGPNITAGSPTTVNWAGGRVLYSTWAWTPGSQPQELSRMPRPDGFARRSHPCVHQRECIVESRSRRQPTDAARNWRGVESGGHAGQPFRHLRFVAHRSAIVVDDFDRWRRREATRQPVRRRAWRRCLTGWTVHPVSDPRRRGKVAMVVTCRLADCRPREVLSGIASTRFRWTPSGRAIAFIESDA